MDQAQIDLDTSQKDLVNLRGEIERVDQDNQALQDRLAGEEAHILLLQVYADVVEARMNLALKDNNAAKAALADTPALLEQFAPNLEAVDSGAAEAALSRLSLAAGEIPGDTKTAASDLAILTEQLSDLEAQLYLEDD
jgi:hypothetical protein